MNKKLDKAHKNLAKAIFGMLKCQEELAIKNSKIMGKALDKYPKNNQKEIVWKLKTF